MRQKMIFVLFFSAMVALPLLTYILFGHPRLVEA
jgi:hypothetical protein